MINKDYKRLGWKVGRLVEDKQMTYGNSFGNSHKILQILYPNGINLEQMEDVLTMARILDKLFRIANKKTAYGESPYRDICGYSLLALQRANDANRDL